MMRKQGILLLLGLLTASAVASGAAETQQVVYYGRDSWLGVALADSTASGAGAEVRDVFPGGPAAQAGLRRGDMIVGLNDRKIETVAGLRAALAGIPANQTARIAIVRNGKPESLQVRLGQRPAELAAVPPMPPMPPIPPIHIPPIHIPPIHIPPMPPMPPNAEAWMGMSASSPMSLGMSVETMPDQLASYFGVKAGEHAVLVRSVQSGSVAQKAGVRAGDVILRLGTQPVHTVNQFWESLRAARGKATTIGVLRHGRPVTVRLASVPVDAGALLPGSAAFKAEIGKEVAEARLSAEAARREFDNPQFRHQIEEAQRQAREAARQWRREAQKLRQQREQWQ